MQVVQTTLNFPNRNYNFSFSSGSISGTHTQGAVQQLRNAEGGGDHLKLWVAALSEIQLQVGENLNKIC